MALLSFMLASVRRGTARNRMRLVEVGACFWHMVDLLWLVIFPLLYLMK